MPDKEVRKKNKKPEKREEKRRIAQIAGVVFVLLLLGTIGSMIASQFFVDAPIWQIPRKFVSGVITPLQKAFASATDGVVDYLRKLKLRDNIEKEYEELRSKIDDLTDQAMLVDELKHQLAKYNDLEDERQRNTDMKGIKANVIGRSSSNYTYTLTIDVGRNQGIEDNMAVVVPGALIGYTYDVMADRCSVMSIIDSNCSIAALIESSRDQGTVRGTLAVNGKKECRMYYLSYTTLPRPGDRVVTSGVGMEFPKGIPIGYVRESTRGLEDSKQYIVIDPVADFDHIEYVLVYRYRPSYAEKADARGVNIKATFVPLETIKPIPTFIGQKVAATPEGETPSPSPSTAPTPNPEELDQPNASIAPPNVSYQDSTRKEPTEDPYSMPSPSPSPEPSPTFSIDQLTVEEDE